MAESTRSQLKLQIYLLREFIQRYSRHDGECEWLTEHKPCTCGFDKQLARVKDALELLHAPDEARALLKSLHAGSNGAGA